MPAPVFSLVALPSGVTTVTSDVPSSETIMQKSEGKRRGFAGFDPQRCGDFLRALHPVKTAAGVAAATGLPAKTVERWLAGTAPSLPAFARLIAVYGPGFAAAAFPGLAWVERAAALARYEQLAASVEATRAQQAALAAQLFGPKP